MELASSEMCCTASRNGSMESRRTSIETTSPQGITPASSMATEALSSDDSSPAPWTQSQSYSGNSGYNQDLHTAASFPMSATKNEKGGLPHSAYDFAEMTSMKSHADHLNMGIDDSNVEAVSTVQNDTCSNLVYVMASGASKILTIFYPCFRCGTTKIRRVITCLETL